MIYVVVVSTGVYNDLFDEERINSYKFLFPDKEKSLVVISDNPDLLDKFLILNKNKSYKDFYGFTITNLPYPFITLFKYTYIADFFKRRKDISKDDKFIYSDAHTFCLNKGINKYNMLYDCYLNKYELCFARNPYYKDDFIKDEIDTRSKHHCTLEEFEANRDKWCQASFLMGRIGALEKLVERLNQYILDDIRYSGDNRKKQCILPNFMEQHYFNYMLLHDELENVCVRPFIERPNFKVHNDTFITCHYNYGKVHEKRDSDKYDINL